MASNSLRFKFLRCLILCLGVTTSSANAIAQVVTLGSSEFNDPVNTSSNEDAVKVDTFVQIDNLPDSDRNLAKPKELTFQFLSPENTNSTDAATELTIQNDDVPFVIAQGKSKKGKKGKKYKKYKKCKKCGDIFFTGIVNATQSFTVQFGVTSKILLQIFEDEATFQSGVPPLQSISYNTACYETILPGVELGSLTLTDYRRAGKARRMTFKYRSSGDSDYTNIVTHRDGTRGTILGRPDDDNYAYIVVSDAKGGKRCKKYKKYKKSYRSSEILFEGTASSNNGADTVSSSSSETLIEIFEDDSQSFFADVRSNYWASNFIARLASIQVIEGFPGDDFFPDATLTQSQFAAIVSRAYNVPSVREVVTIGNLSRSYWAYNAIQKAYSMGFIEISSNNFNPNRDLTKLDVLVAIAKGLGYTQVSSGQSVDEILSIFADSNTIPVESRVYIASLVEKGILVNYPNVNSLNLRQPISRAETCALVYQSLVTTGKVESINSSYIVR